MSNKNCIICGSLFTPKKSTTLCCSIDCTKTNDKINKLKSKTKKLSKLPKYEVVECLICNNLFTGTMKKHLRVSHDMSVEEYQAKYNNAPVVSTKYSNDLSEKYSGSNNPGYQHGGKLSPFSLKSEHHTKEQVKEIRKRAIMNSLANENNATHATKLSYYTDKGHSLEEAKSLLTERQQTFSLEICIDKYGEIEGRKIWEERQRKWQDSISSRLISDMNDPVNNGIENNKLWGIEEYYNCSGIFYIIDLGNDFVKIGISTRVLEDRFDRIDLSKYENKYEFNYDKINDAFKIEQIMKRLLDKCKIGTDESIKGFGWTETFKTEFNKVYDIYNLISNDIEYYFNKYVK